MFGKGADAPKLFAGFVSAAYLTAEYRLEQENKQQTVGEEENLCVCESASMGRD